MKLYLISTCLLLICFTSHTQKLKVEKRVTDYSVYVIGDGFEGVIFDGTFKSGSKFNNFTRFTPKGKDVLSAENILKNFIYDKKKLNNSDDQFIRNNLQKYLRQYTGYINEKGEKVIHINALWKESVLYFEQPIAGYKTIKWTEAYSYVNDGGHHYWQVKVNLSTGEVFNYWVNGIG
ncbi:hypothetical protein IM792_00510 [Mucilaginibacter sp. JRF]|uniref:hypothetical protein n=1 Tax=Mucilaginibacter sp. JRF TaxID=2780088 RepID=UPI00188078D9|nr:hypothetical protein [Mucilaginibacter sp. JRF]MBE9582917.1 hypothetical protein [Mucilaginibacter sp. JRF]